MKSQQPKVLHLYFQELLNFFTDDNSDNSDEQDDNGDEAGLEEEDELDDYGNPFQQPPPAAAGLNTPIITCSLASIVVITRVLRSAAAGRGCLKGLP